MKATTTATSKNVPGTTVTWAEVNATAARFSDVSLAEAIRITIANQAAGETVPTAEVSREDAIAAAAAEMLAYMAQK